MEQKVYQKRSLTWSRKKTTCIYIQFLQVKRVTHLGSNGASDSGFMESLHRDLNTRNASFCVMWENLTAPPPWLLTEVDDALPSTSVPDSLWVSPSSSDIGEDVSVGVEGTWRSYCGSPLIFGFSGVLSITSPFGRMFSSIDKRKKDMLETCKEHNVIKDNNFTSHVHIIMVERKWEWFFETKTANEISLLLLNCINCYINTIMTHKVLLYSQQFMVCKLLRRLWHFKVDSIIVGVHVGGWFCYDNLKFFLKNQQINGKESSWLWSPSR